MLDLIIIGAGPAGLSACLYASRAGLDVLIFDSAAPGGKLNVTAQIENYPGLKPTPGPEIAFTMYESALSFGAKMEYGEVLDIKDYGDYKEVKGVKVPFNIIQNVGFELDIKMSAVKINEGLSDADFQ